MRYAIITDEFNKDLATALISKLKGDVFVNNSMFDESEYDFIIFLYCGNYGKVTRDILMCADNIFDSKAILISTDKLPLDANVRMNKILHLNGNLVLNAFNTLGKNSLEDIINYINSEKIVFHGKGFYERVGGFFSRKLGGKNGN